MIAPRPLAAEAIRRGLTAAVVGRQLYVLAEVDSTNAELRRLARAGAPAGTVVIAEAQRAGRGRRGQEWFSPAGVNVHASALLRPSLPGRGLGVFSFIASLALADAISAEGVTPGIKWPNDVLVGGRKVAGTLVESAMRGDEVEYVILGVGVNVNVDPAVIRERLGAAGVFATSLAAEVGHPIDRNVFAAAYLGRLDAWAATWEREGPAPILAGWRDRDILGGRRVEVRGAHASWEGRVIDVDETGSLVVDEPFGRRHALTSEEVRIRE